MVRLGPIYPINQIISIAREDWLVRLRDLNVALKKTSLRWQEEFPFFIYSIWKTRNENHHSKNRKINITRTMTHSKDYISVTGTSKEASCNDLNHHYLGWKKVGSRPVILRAAAPEQNKLAPNREKLASKRDRHGSMQITRNPIFSILLK